MSKVRITLDLPIEMFDVVNEECERLDRSRNWMINKALQEYFENKKEDAKK
jgi:hypothetical protein